MSHTVLTGILRKHTPTSYNIDQELYVSGKWENNFTYNNYFKGARPIGNTKFIKPTLGEIVFVKGAPMNKQQKQAKYNADAIDKNNSDNAFFGEQKDNIGQTGNMTLDNGKTNTILEKFSQLNIKNKSQFSSSLTDEQPQGFISRPVQGNTNSKSRFGSIAETNYTDSFTGRRRDRQQRWMDNQPTTTHYNFPKNTAKTFTTIPRPAPQFLPNQSSSSFIPIGHEWAPKL